MFFKKIILSILFIFCFINPYSFVKASDLYSAKQYSGLIGDTITIYYDSSTENCLASPNPSARVEINGITANIKSWYNCIGQVNIKITESLSSGNIIVYDYINTAHNAGYLTVEGNPVIYSISPESVIPGETYITIKGINFGSDFYENTLYISGKNNSSYGDFDGLIEIDRASWTENEISFLAPENIKSGKIYIRKSNGFGSYTDFAESYFFYIQPKIDRYSQYTGTIGNQITIYGSNLTGNFAADTSINYGIKVYFNGTPAGIIEWEDSYVIVEVPPGAGTGNIKIELYSNDIDKSIYDIGEVFTILEGTANDEYSPYQTYLNQINIKKAWNYTTGSKDIIVAVIDDGVYINHPELQYNIWQNEKEIIGNGKDDDNNGYVDDRLGWDFVSNESEMTTRGTHGTMVAGIIGAVGNNNQGITGINWNTKIMSLIACTEYGCDVDAIKKAIRYAVDNDADIINLSLSSTMTIGYTDKFDDIIEYAYNKNVLIVAAAGNGDLEGDIGQNLNIIPQSPICNDVGKNMVLGVGAVTEDGYRTSWSNYGKCVDIYAPGESIISTAVPYYSTFEDFYDFGDGTSFSAPIVSGIAALMKSKYPNITNKAIINRIITKNTSGIIDASKLFYSLLDNEKIDLNKLFVDSEKELINNIDKTLSKRLKGKILLQVEEKGAGWYINPDNEKRYYLGLPSDAFQVMRELGLGVSNENFDSWGEYAPKNLSGKILLKVEDKGQAYYVNPDDLKMYSLGLPSDAFQVMRNLGLGITNDDIRKIDIN
ncbi:hypothetical protein EOM09_01610 [bacterium]|nr:hypothetical protein [bacterium]